MIGIVAEWIEHLAADAAVFARQTALLGQPEELRAWCPEITRYRNRLRVLAEGMSAEIERMAESLEAPDGDEGEPQEQEAR